MAGSIGRKMEGRSGSRGAAPGGGAGGEAPVGGLGGGRSPPTGRTKLFYFGEKTNMIIRKSKKFIKKKHARFNKDSWKIIKKKKTSENILYNIRKMR